MKIKNNCNNFYKNNNYYKISKIIIKIIIITLTTLHTAVGPLQRASGIWAHMRSVVVRPFGRVRQ